MTLIVRKPHLRGRGPHIPPLDRVVQYDFQPGYVVFTQPTAKRLRVKVGGTFIADSRRAILLWETEHQVKYYIPLTDIRMDLMRPSPTRIVCPFKGEARHYTLALDGRAIEDIMWQHASPPAACPPIGDYGAFHWGKVDHWYEEDEEVFIHPRDPYRRIDCLPSSRLVQVHLNGELVAESRRSVMLLETGLPTRYYLLAEDVRPGILSPSDYSTGCPYKGWASYHHVTVGGRLYENMVWFYRDPKPEVLRIKDRLSFLNEFVDRVVVDGEALPRPATAISDGYEDGSVLPLGRQSASHSTSSG
jgi:uncharacterized protein (DUF427 family)